MVNFPCMRKGTVPQGRRLGGRLASEPDVPAWTEDRRDQSNHDETETESQLDE
jgi:hypothetical protein